MSSALLGTCNDASGEADGAFRWQEEYIKDETKHLKREMLRAQEEVCSPHLQ